MTLDPSNNGGKKTFTLVNEESPTDTSVSGRAARCHLLNIGDSVRVTVRNPTGKLTLDALEHILESTNPFCRYVPERANVSLDGDDGSPYQSRTYTLFDATSKLISALLEGKIEAPLNLKFRPPGSADIDFAHKKRKAILFTFEPGATLTDEEKKKKRDRKFNELFQLIGVPPITPFWANEERTRYNGIVDEEKLDTILTALNGPTGEQGYTQTGEFGRGPWASMKTTHRLMPELLMQRHPIQKRQDGVCKADCRTVIRHGPTHHT
jgi:hypothetical protein